MVVLIEVVGEAVGIHESLSALREDVHRPLQKLCLYRCRGIMEGGEGKGGGEGEGRGGEGGRGKNKGTGGEETAQGRERERNSEGMEGRSR